MISNGILVEMLNFICHSIMILTRLVNLQIEKYYKFPLLSIVFQVQLSEQDGDQPTEACF